MGVFNKRNEFFISIDEKEKAQVLFAVTETKVTNQTEANTEENTTSQDLICGFVNLAANGPIHPKRKTVLYLKEHGLNAQECRPTELNKSK